VSLYENEEPSLLTFRHKGFSTLLQKIVSASEIKMTSPIGFCKAPNSNVFPGNDYCRFYWLFRKLSLFTLFKNFYDQI